MNNHAGIMLVMAFIGISLVITGLATVNAIRDSHKTVTCTYNWPEYNHGDLRHPNTPERD